MHRSKKKRNIIIFSLVGVLLCMVAGYAAFQTQLKVTGTSKVTSNWDIEITNVTEGTPTGSAENAVAPSYDKLWASMEANLYDKGDAMEYDVTIENKGTLDAKLNDIITNLENSNSEAVIITFSGYTKGEVLKSKATKVIHVKIEYNPEYEGGETSSEVEINFDYTQNNNEENNPDSQYLLTYDYSTNGGQSVELTEELISSGSNVDLSNTATKEGWKFVGWNTDKDAQIGLKSYQMPTENTTLYAIYSKTLKVTYEKDDNVESIGKTEDSCNIYNNGISCEITLPDITVNDEKATVGWYNEEEKIGKPNDKYSISNDITLRAKAEGEPYMMARDDNYAFWSEEYRTKIKTIDFVDNKNIPDNAVASWDVSDKKDKSVMAWIINDPDNSGYYKLYIGGTDGVIANENCSDFFDSFTEVISIDLQKLDTSRVTNMHDFFCDDWSLTSIEFGNIDTSQVTDMSGMFGRCYALQDLNLNVFNTNNVTDMKSMFLDCHSLTVLEINNFDTSNVTNMRTMFGRCYALENIELSNFNTRKVEDMYGMFMLCTSLTTIDISSFNTSNVTDMSWIFAMYDGEIAKDSKLTKIIGIENLNTSNVTNMSSIFRYDLNLTGSLNLSNWDTSNVTNMSNLFDCLSNVESIDVSGWNTSKVVNMEGLFYDSVVEKLNLCSFNTANVTNMNYMFQGTPNLQNAYVGTNWTTANATTTDMFLYSNISQVTQSNNCEIDAEDMSLSISTSSTTNSITVVANATADSGIAKYEYSKDSGNSWEDSTNNTYTFTNFTQGTSYNIMVRVTSNIGKQTSSSKTVTSSRITTPTFSENGTSPKTVTIRYPSGCGNTYTCTYQKDNGNNITVTSTTASVSFTASGSLVAKVSDGTNSVSSSYTVTVLPYTPGQATNVITQLLSKNTNELYRDDHNNIRYYGATPNNYVRFNNGKWRIMGVIDGKVKIAADGGASKQWNSSNSNNWNNSSLKAYLNDEFYNSIETKSKGMISQETYYLGGATSSNYATLTASGYYNAERSKTVHSGNPTTTTQNIGLMYPSDYGYASGSSCLSTALNNYMGTCKNSNYLFQKQNEWLQTPFASSSNTAAFLLSSGFVDGYGNAVNYSGQARPVLYLKSDVQIIGGTGTSSDPFNLAQ